MYRSSSQAKPHALIEHRERHIVMDHGGLPQPSQKSFRISLPIETLAIRPIILVVGSIYSPCVIRRS
jgi:hypothetical protein